MLHIEIIVCVSLKFKGKLQLNVTFAWQINLLTLTSDEAKIGKLQLIHR